MPYSKYSPKQKKLAAVAPPRKKITQADLRKVRGSKKKVLNPGLNRNGVQSQVSLPVKPEKGIFLKKQLNLYHLPNMLLQQELNEQEQKPGSNL
jgi:hypothetical protein